MSPLVCARAFALCLASAAPVGCDSAERAGPPASETRSPPAAASTSAKPRAPTPQASPAEPSSLGARLAAARASNALGFDLYANVRSARGNVALSPLSITSALAMAWVGARGKTAAGMKRTLHLVEGGDDLLPAIAALAAPSDGPATLRVANRLFVEQSYPLLPAYTAAVAAAFQARPEAVDFLHASDAGRARVNAWVERETEGHIKDLIPPAGVNDGTHVVLANAMYFKGQWARPFDESLTSAQPFRKTPWSSTLVPTLYRLGTYSFAATSGVEVIELPYAIGQAGQVLAMTVVLPETVDGLAALEARLSPALLDSWTGATISEHVELWLPRVELVPGEPLRLGAALRALGMARAFDPAAADFTGIAAPSSPDDRMVLDDVFHKAFVKIDEEGTVAATATGGEVGLSGLGPAPAYKQFKADHPFLFFVRDMRTYAILFMGRVSDPG